MNIRNASKFCLFHCDHVCNIKKCHALNKEIRKEKKKIDCWRLPPTICEKEKGNQIKRKFRHLMSYLRSHNLQIISQNYIFIF